MWVDKAIMRSGVKSVVAYMGVKEKKSGGGGVGRKIKEKEAGEEGGKERGQGKKEKGRTRREEGDRGKTERRVRVGERKGNNFNYSHHICGT